MKRGELDCLLSTRRPSAWRALALLSPLGKKAGSGVQPAGWCTARLLGSSVGPLRDLSSSTAILLLSTPKHKPGKPFDGLGRTLPFDVDLPLCLPPLLKLSSLLSPSLSSSALAGTAPQLDLPRPHPQASAPPTASRPFSREHL